MVSPPIVNERLIKEKLTVHRNNIKMGEGTLRMLSMKTVIHNVAFFINNSSQVHRVENLPEVLLTDLEDLLSLLSNYFASNSTFFQAPSMRMSWWRFRALLLHSRLPKLRLPGLYHCSNEHELDFGIGYLLDRVGAKCSELLLIESQEVIKEVVVTPEKEVFIKEAFFQALPTLSNLRVVKIELFLCDDWALQQFAMHCQNIVILKVALAVPEVSDVGIQALAKLTHLKQFLFDYYRKEFKTLKLVLKYYLLCARHLPNLKIVGHEYTNDLDDYQYCDEETGKYFSHSQILQLPLELGLEQVLLNWEVVTKPLCLLPNLRSLLLYSSSREYAVGLCNRYSSISEIGLCDAEIDTIVAAVQVVGKRLEKLIVLNTCTLSGIVLPLDLILKLCPNLKHLKVNRYLLDNVDYSYLKDDVRCLQTIDLNFNKRQPLPHGFLITMLGAPLLKKVGFRRLYPTKDEVDALLASVRQGSILTNLESFKWFNNYLVNDTIMEPWMASKIHFQLLLDSIQVLLVQN